ncbi:MAG TPA: acyltransferase [Solirubrobacteraceae bacterium]|jgi:peptidoglycan/LPS O-acetylase OafA/YrhL
MTTIADSPVPTAPAVAARAPRVANVDVLRALAALGVLAIHAYALGGRVAPIKAQHVYDVPLITLATGVWLFFAISGYVIGRPFIERLLAGQSPPKLAGYARRRAVRIFPLYWIALTAVIVIDGSAGTQRWQLPFHYLLLNNLIPGRQEALFPAAWTLTLEALFYVVLPLLAAAVAVCARRSRRGRLISAERLAGWILASWVLSIAFTVFADLLGDGQAGLWLRGSLPSMWQMFCPGLLLAVAPRLRAPRPRRWLVELPGRGWPAVLVAAAVLIPAAVLGAAAPLRFGVVPYQLMVDASRPLFAVGYGLIVAVAIATRPWHARWLLALGLASYGIYLLHPVVESLLVQAGLIPDGHDTLAAFAINTAVLGLLTVPLAMASWRWLERPLIGRAARPEALRAAPEH